MTASLAHTPSRRAFLRQVAAGSLLTQVPLTLQSQVPRPPKPIRAAQIGTGHAHAAGKWKTLLRSEDFQMVGLTEPDPAWHAMAAAASISLIALLVAMNSIAIVLRQHFRRRLN